MALPTKATSQITDASQVATPAPDEMQTILPQRLESLSSSPDEQQTILPGSLNKAGDRSPVPEQEACFPQIPGYRIIKELGKGGMGVVYQSEQIKLHRLVALKMIRG